MSISDLARWYSQNYSAEQDYAKEVAYRKKKLAGQPDTFGFAHKTTQLDGLVRTIAYGTNLQAGNIVQSWTGTTNAFGRYVFPNTNVKIETRNLIIDYGEGVCPDELPSPIYINNELIEKFSNLEAQYRQGSMNQDGMTGFEDQKKELKFDYELLEADEPFVVTTPDEFFDDIEFTLFWPSGMRRLTKDGHNWETSVHFHIDISVKDADDWTYILNADITDLTLQPKYKHFKVSDYGFNCVRGTQYDIRFSRETTDGVESITDRCELRSVREVIEVAATRPNRSLLGLRAVATEALGEDIDVEVVRKGKIIATFDAAGVQTLEHSNNRAWVVYDFLTKPVIVGDGDGTPYSISRYEGTDPDDMDWDFFYAWSVFCDENTPDGHGGVEPRCTCDLQIDTTVKTFELARAMALVGRAHIYYDKNIITGWIEDAVTSHTDLVTMDAMMEKSWENTWSEEDDYEGTFKVNFNNAAKGYEPDSITYSNENAGNYQTILEVDGIGLTTSGQAVHYARYLSEGNRLIINQNKYKVAKRGFRYKLGQVIRLQCKPADWGEGYRVVSATAGTITVDRDASDEVTVGDALYIQTYNAGTEKVETDTYEVTDVVGAVITVERAWDLNPVKGNLVAVGFTKLRRIHKIDGSSDNYFTVTVKTYDPEFHDCDDYIPIIGDDNYVHPGILPRSVAPVDAARIRDKTLAVYTPATNINEAATSNIDWDLVTGTISWAKTDAVFDCTFITHGVSYAITPDSSTKKYIYWDPTSPNVFLGTDSEVTAEGGGDHWIVKIQEGGNLIVSSPRRLAHTAEIADNATVDEDTSYTAAETGWLGIPGAGATEIASVEIPLLEGRYLQLYTCATFKNYIAAERIVDFYIQYSIDEGVNWVWLAMWTGEGFGQNCTLDASETRTLSFTSDMATDKFVADAIEVIDFRVMACCENDNTSIKASYCRLNVLQNKGK